MANESVRRALELAKQGDANAMEEVRAWQRGQREANRRVEELKLRLLQLSEKHWEQSINILKGWLDKG